MLNANFSHSPPTFGRSVWPDNETARNFLNFSGAADTMAEIIVQARGRPISIGVSGAWGIGKSLMIKLTQSALAGRPRVHFRRIRTSNSTPGLHQGYDEARAALMDVIATKLQAEAEARRTAVEKVKGVLKRVKRLRAGLAHVRQRSDLRMR